MPVIPIAQEVLEFEVILYGPFFKKNHWGGGVEKTETDLLFLICNFATHVQLSGESTEEELLRRLQQIKEGPPPQSPDENRGTFCLGRWVGVGNIGTFE